MANAAILPASKKENGQKTGSRETDRSWVELYLPENVKPYACLMRLHIFEPIWMVTCPGPWAVALAADPGSSADAKMLAVISLVGVMSHSIGCTINDYLDRDLDAKVERTKSRPLASGALTPFQGLAFLCLQVVLCYSLLLPVNNLSRRLWIVCMLLSFTYPLMKRVTYWAEALIYANLEKFIEAEAPYLFVQPQAYLGLSANFSVLCGWSAVKGALDAYILLPLYISGVLWTLMYDSIYAYHDREEDIKAGAKSTTIIFGESIKVWTTAFGMMCIGGLALTGIAANLGWMYYAFLAAASSQLTWQIYTLDLTSAEDCSRKFLSNAKFGTIILVGIILGRLFN